MQKYDTMDGAMNVSNSKNEFSGCKIQLLIRNSRVKMLGNERTDGLLYTMGGSGSDCNCSGRGRRN